MSRHKKTRQQKVMADLRRQHFVYTLENKNLPTITQPVIAISSFAYVRHDILKTFLLTLAIIGAELILFLLLKKHVLVLPIIKY